MAETIRNTFLKQHVYRQIADFDNNRLIKIKIIGKIIFLLQIFFLENYFSSFKLFFQ